MDPIITSAIIGASGVILGNAITLIAQWNIGKQNSMQRKIEKLQKEVIARQAQEKIASEWLVELGQASSEQAAKLALRNRTEQATGYRPAMSPSVLKS